MVLPTWLSSVSGPGYHTCFRGPAFTRGAQQNSHQWLLCACLTLCHLKLPTEATEDPTCSWQSLLMENCFLCPLARISLQRPSTPFLLYFCYVLNLMMQFITLSSPGLGVWLFTCLFKSQQVHRFIFPFVLGKWKAERLHFTGLFPRLMLCMVLDKV